MGLTWEEMSELEWKYSIERVSPHVEFVEFEARFELTYDLDFQVHHQNFSASLDGHAFEA